MKKLYVVAAAFGLLMFSCRPVSLTEESPEEIPTTVEANSVAEEAYRAPDLVFEDASVTSSTNIHYTGGYCNECHEQSPVEGGLTYLKFDGSYDRLCRCHTDPHSKPIHSVDIIPSPEKAENIPPDFPLEDGELTCLTCHNIYLQCRKRLFGKNSLRGIPFEQRTDFCYKCHEKANYQRLDPHEQINDAGEVIIEKCLFCHKEQPDTAHATFREVKFVGDIEVLCRRCHLISGNHSGNYDHMGIVPSVKRLEIMKGMEEKFNIILPLDEQGKMTCITCHNPHEKGVIPDRLPGAQGAGGEYRHRLPGKLCKECHEI